MSEADGYDAFISYAHVDLVFAEKAHRRLTAAGFRVWFDRARLKPGFDWHREIEAGCEGSRVLLPVLTPNWQRSEWTKFETYGAEAVIPLIVQGEIDEIFTPPLSRFQGQRVEFNHADAGEDAWKRVFAAIRARLTEPPPDKLARMADVRYAPNPYFVGREKELIEIHEALHQLPTAVLTQGQVRAIAALGGVGKTTLARQYVEKFWRCYPQILWVDCRVGVEAEFARICDLILPERHQSTNVVEKAQRALHALQSRDERLLIIDNAQDEASIQSWIPKTGHCKTLITSRFSAWSAGVPSYSINVLEPDPAHTLLATRAGRRSFGSLSTDEQAECARLAEDLGYLPLALEQAAAYMGQQGSEFGFADYRRLYQEATAELLAQGVLGSTEYPDSVITTWKATTNSLGPEARAVLRLCAYLSSAPLPLSALIAGAEIIRDESAEIGSAAPAQPANAETWVRGIVQQLRAYSMVDADGQSISLHPLVQTVERLQIEGRAGLGNRTLMNCLRWISTVFLGNPQDVASWSTLDPISPHAVALASHATPVGILHPTARIMLTAGTLYLSKGQYRRAESLLRGALELEERSSTSEHLQLAEVVSNLAMALQEQNRLADAEKLIRRALTIDEKHGYRHPKRVARDLSNLARLLVEMNRPTEAEPLYVRALYVLSSNDTLEGHHGAIVLNNYAELLRLTGRLPQAETVYLRVLAIYERIFGQHHPFAATSLNNLSLVNTATGRLEDAEEAVRLALAIDRKCYGSEHPNVARDLNTLAMCLVRTNREQEAKALVQQALMIDENAFGKRHPRVALRLNNLGKLLQELGEPTQGEPLMRRALEILLEDAQGAGRPNAHLRPTADNYVALLHTLGHDEVEAQRQLDVMLAKYGVSLD